MSKSKAAGNKSQDPEQRTKPILSLLKRTYPDARCSLQHRNAFELLIATILSAQCTDERVNMVTKDLFKKYRTPADLAAVSQEKLEKEIQSTGFFRNKAKSLRGMAAALVERFDGKVPNTMDELTGLPGVGRKTANVILGNAFHVNVGVVVDTHVGRISQRLHLTGQSDPVKIEQDLMRIVPREDWTVFSHLLIYHGRKICVARKPRCPQCPLLPHCPTGRELVKE
jgi:endonuclease-3